MSETSGRRYTARRAVCLGDVLPSGAVRLDALARYLQDVASDDGIDAAIDHDQTWVVRRTTLTIGRRPRLRRAARDRHVGVGPRVGAGPSVGTDHPLRRLCAGEVAVEAVALWVCMDAATRRPARLSARFWQMYGEAVGGRSCHPDSPTRTRRRSAPRDPGLAAPGLDIDVFDHVNNTGDVGGVRR